MRFSSVHFAHAVVKVTPFRALVETTESVLPGPKYLTVSYYLLRDCCSRAAITQVHVQKAYSYISGYGCVQTCCLLDAYRANMYMNM